VASNSSLEDTVIVPLMLAPKEKELLGISNITLVFGFLNLLKKPTDFYLRLDNILKKKYLFMICVSLLLKDKHGFLRYNIETFSLSRFPFCPCWGGFSPQIPN
jgi:hypothetical protein